MFSTMIAASLISILLNVFIVRGVFAWIGRGASKQGATKSAEQMSTLTETPKSATA